MTTQEVIDEIKKEIEKRMSFHKEKEEECFLNNHSQWAIHSSSRMEDLAILKLIDLIKMKIF